MTVPEPTARPTRYEVSCFPEDDDDAFHFTISVEYRGHGLWGVFRYKECLGSDDVWGYEPLPTYRDSEWLATHRFDLDTALELAKRHAPHLTVMGWSAAQVLARRAALPGE